MSIDPDVVIELEAVQGRLTALEASVTTPSEREFWAKLTAELAAGNSGIFEVLLAAFPE